MQFKAFLEGPIQALLSSLTVVVGLAGLVGGAFMLQSMIRVSLDGRPVAVLDLIFTAFLLAIAAFVGLLWLIGSRLDLRRARQYASRLNYSRSEFKARLGVEIPFLIALLRHEKGFIAKEQIWEGKPRMGSAIVSNTISALLQQTDQRAQALCNTITVQSCFRFSYDELSKFPIKMDDGEEAIITEREVTVIFNLPPGGVKLYFPTLGATVQVGGDSQ